MKHRLKNFGILIIDYIRITDNFLILMSIGASILSCFLIASLYPESISTLKPVYTQMGASFAGLVLAIFVSHFDYHQIANLWKIIGISALTLSLLVFTPLGTLRGGNDMSGPGSGSEDLNWLNLGFVTLQPSEFLKVAFVITFSYHCYKVSNRINEPRMLLLLFAHALIPIGIIYLQNDYGTMSVFVFIFICILFIAGINWKVILGGIGVGIFIVILVLTNTIPAYLLQRIKILEDLDSAKRGLGLQQYTGRITLATGKMFGKGFQSNDLLTNTPELYNDMVFSHVGQIVGFVGCACVLLWVVLYCLRLLQNGIKAQDNLGYFLCVGCFAVIFFQSLINIGMVLCLLPIIGVTLPFISAGGSSVISTYLLLGLAISVHNHTYKATLF
ncbi:MAG: FtsW/RodA/SpoVE family cell cycle protein [Oscillospiraceae bacterium]|nr:FtsW/RodA/SpoVE family cell cycle protein [Oscillospiraceae bacterium]